MRRATTIITGKKGEGKTTKIREITDILLNEDVSCQGIIANAHFINGERNTYYAEDIAKGLPSGRLCTSIAVSNYQQIGKFFFNIELIKRFEDSYIKTDFSKTIFVIDEIGPFELEGYVWADLLKTIINNYNYNLLLSIRESLIDKIIYEFDLKNTQVFDIKSDNRIIINNLLKHQL